MTLRTMLLFLVPCALLCQSEPAKDKKQPKLYDVPEAYEAYAALLPSEWPSRVAHATKLMIRSETVPYTNCLRVGDGKDKDVDSAIANYLELNEETRLLVRAFHIDLPYELTSKNDSSLPDTGGLIEVSAVGFNADKTVAVVYMGHHCGGLCGGGAIHVLLKSHGRWQPYHTNSINNVIGCPWDS